MMERTREAAVWERVRAASACAPMPEVKPEPECKTAVHKKCTPQSGVQICGGLPLLVLLVILLRG